MLGGGMRQAGILAAAGIVALETMVDRLREDHINAIRFAQGLTDIRGISLERDDIPTNIVMFTLSPELSSSDFTRGMENAGVKFGLRGRNSFRAVTHRMVSPEDIDEAIRRIETVCSKL
jgi:threonine aldolase